MMEPSTSYSPSASSSSSGDETKLFVGGISWETTSHCLVEYFSKYGKVAWATIIRNKIGVSKGFAFVQFVDLAAVERALADTREHIILGIKVEVKKAIPKCPGYQNHQHLHANQYQDRNGELINNITNSHNGISFNPRKIFVGGLPPKLTEDEFSSFFEQFGKITNAVLLHDKFGRLRGFGFIEFDSAEVVENVLQNRFYELKDKKVEVKRAVPKVANNYDKEINSYFSEHLMIGSGGGYVFDYEQADFHPMYGLRYAGLQDYASPFFPDYTPQAWGFIGGYPTGCYDGLGYSSLHADLRSPWNVQELVPPLHSLMPYSANSLYPGYLDNGFSGYMNLPDHRYNATIWCGNNSNNENWKHNLSNMQSQNIDDTTPQLDGDDKTSKADGDDSTPQLDGDDKTSKADGDDTTPQHDKDGNSAEQPYSYCHNSNENGKQNLFDMEPQNIEHTTTLSNGDDKILKPDDDTTSQYYEDCNSVEQLYSYCNDSNENGKQNLSDIQSQNIEDTTPQPNGDDKLLKPDSDDTTPQH